MYTLEYLPCAKQDMLDMVRYISKELCNPAAAARLAEELISAADRIPEFPYANAVYTPIRPLGHEYRKLLVQNYMLLYWVEESTKTVTIARVIYAKRDFEQLL